MNDPPVVTSEPPLSASGGDEWVYRVLALDGDRDRLAFSLATSPGGMAINGSTGVITWIPQKWGRYPVAVSVSDGSSVAWQNFTLAVPNRAPELSSEPVRNAFIGQPYSYQVRATDPDGDPLTFSLATGLDGFTIDPAVGLISGVPMVLGDHELTVAVSDGRAGAYQNFTLKVVWPNRAPFITSNAATTATEGLTYAYDVRAYDNDKDVLEFSLESGPEWLLLDPAGGRLSGTPAQAGNFTVVVAVSDGRGGAGRQEFTLKVADSVPPSVSLDAPAGKVRGAIGLGGAVTRGTREVVSVEVRLDGGQWRPVAFNSTWSMSLDTRGLRTGDHIVEARAYDGLEYSTMAGAMLEVDNSGDIRTGGAGPGALALVAAAAACALAAAGAAALVWRRKAGK
jgi:hypothetical protein